MNALLTIMIICFGISVYSWAEELPAKVEIQTQAVTEASVDSTPSVDVDRASSSSAGVPPAGSDQATGTGSAPVAQDPCKDLLPQAEKDYQALAEKYQQIKSGQQNSYESYTGSFSEMTDVLFRLTEEKEQETKAISGSRDQLKVSVQNFNDNRSAENSKALQDQYMDLTVRLYSSVMDGQKILETLKSQLFKVESTRSQFENSKAELEKIDHQRLALEGKLISLKIRCQSDR